MKRTRHQKADSSGKVRIIAGRWRGRKLTVADEPGLRPTTDRNRETLFNWLQGNIVGADCLDVFAGTGCLSFEALSRDAASAVMVENNSGLVQLLKENKNNFPAETATVIQADALSWLQSCQQSFDIIFLDPPFNQDLIDKSCQIICQHNCLKENGLIYIESEAGLSLPDMLQVHKQKQTPQVQYGLYTLKR